MAANSAMKVLCPKCKEVITLDYLEKHDEQQSICPRCRVQIYATHNNSEYREQWAVTFEKPVPKPRKPLPCVYKVLIIFGVLLILLFIIAFIRARELNELERIQEPNTYGNSQDNDQWTGSSRAEGRVVDRSLRDERRLPAQVLPFPRIDAAGIVSHVRRSR